MQQKEVLIIVAVVAAGFFLFNGGFFSGRAISTDKQIYSYPQETDGEPSDAYTELIPQPVGTGTGGGGSFICGLTEYSGECSGVSMFACLKPGRGWREGDRPSFDASGQTIEQACNAATTICSRDCEDKLSQIGRYCSTWCRMYFPNCYPTWAITNAHTCRAENSPDYRCGTFDRSAPCPAEGSFTAQCLCVQEPITVP